MRALITGASGQVGRELVQLAPAGVEVLSVDRARLDVSDPVAVSECVKQFRPSVILNAAAYTAVDRAEQEAEACEAVNARAPSLLAAAAGSIPGCRLVHISTDYVFAGTGCRPYLPSDPTGPVSVYGRTKLAGESAVLAMGKAGVVVRTAWVYSRRGPSFLHTMMRLMRERGAVRVVADQIGTPTDARSVATALWAIAEKNDLSGVFHWVDAGAASWYDFAVAIAEEAALRKLLPPTVQVTPIGTDEYPTPATRPSYSLLDTRLAVAAVGYRPPHWRSQLRSVLNDF